MCRLSGVKKKERAISRILFPVMGHDHFTRMPITRHLLQPTRKHRTGRPYRFPIWSCSEWGLPCHPCRHGRGELLPRHFTLTRNTSGGLLSVALSPGHPEFALRTILPCGVRTFLSGSWPERSCTRSRIECSWKFSKMKEKRAEIFKPVPSPPPADNTKCADRSGSRGSCPPSTAG